MALFFSIFLITIMIVIANSELSSYVIDNDISEYVNETGSFPDTPEAYESIRNKSSGIRLLINFVLVTILTFLYSLLSKSRRSNSKT